MEVLQNFTMATDVSTNAALEGGEDENNKSSKKNHKKYRRDKPWDNEDIDHWKVVPWNSNDDKGNESQSQPQLPGGRLLEESSFATLFPKYRESYLRQVWPVVTRSLDKYGIACEIDLFEHWKSIIK